MLGNGEVRLKTGNNLYLGIESGEPRNGGLTLVGRYKQAWRLEQQGSQYKRVTLLPPGIRASLMRKD